jgi:hypothetical protein
MLHRQVVKLGIEVTCAKRAIEFFEDDEMMPILLYDVTHKRGWFMKASGVILHIIQTRHSKRPFQIDGKAVPLLGADPELKDNEASENAIMQMSSLKLFKDDTKRDKEYYFVNLVSDIWALLEVLSEVQTSNI